MAGRWEHRAELAHPVFIPEAEVPIPPSFTSRRIWVEEPPLAGRITFDDDAEARRWDGEIRALLRQSMQSRRGEREAQARLLAMLTDAEARGHQTERSRSWGQLNPDQRIFIDHALGPDRTGRWIDPSRTTARTTPPPNWDSAQVATLLADMERVRSEIGAAPREDIYDTWLNGERAETWRNVTISPWTRALGDDRMESFRTAHSTNFLIEGIRGKKATAVIIDDIQGEKKLSESDDPFADSQKGGHGSAYIGVADASGSGEIMYWNNNGSISVSRTGMLLARYYNSDERVALLIDRSKLKAAVHIHPDAKKLRLASGLHDHQGGARWTDGTAGLTHRVLTYFPGEGWHRRVLATVKSKRLGWLPIDPHEEHP